MDRCMNIDYRGRRTHRPLAHGKYYSMRRLAVGPRAVRRMTTVPAVIGSPGSARYVNSGASGPIPVADTRVAAQSADVYSETYADQLRSDRRNDLERFR